MNQQQRDFDRAQAQYDSMEPPEDDGAMCDYCGFTPCHCEMIDREYDREDNH